MANNCGEQFCGFAAALTNNCFEERTTTLGSSFRKQLWGLLSVVILGRNSSSFGEQLFGAALDNFGSGFGEQPCGEALWSSFGKQEQL